MGKGCCHERVILETAGCKDFFREEDILHCSLTLLPLTLCCSKTRARVGLGLAGFAGRCYGSIAGDKKSGGRNTGHI